MTTDRSHHAEHFISVRIWRYMCKTTVWPLCSIFCNGGHVFWRIKNLNITFVQDTLKNISAKFHIIPLGSFREEDFWKIVNRQRRQMPSDGNSSHGLRPGELKRSPSNLQLIWREDLNFICRNDRILLRWIIARNLFTGYKRGIEW